MTDRAADGKQRPEKQVPDKKVPDKTMLDKKVPEKRMLVALEQVRASCLRLPLASERLSHGQPSFFVADKKCFVMFLDNHHDDDRLALWCAAPPGVQATMIDEDPEQFFYPPYVGYRGWLGVRLDRDPDWDEVTAIVTEAYRCCAAKKLIAELDTT